eukprot:12329249-Ditylum_brightwellii.AAC.1
MNNSNKSKLQTTINNCYNNLDAALHCQEEEHTQSDSTDQDTITEIDTTYGNNIIQNIDESISCVFTNNVNGFTTASNGDEVLEEKTVLKAFNASVSTLSETNLNWEMPGVYEN